MLPSMAFKKFLKGSINSYLKGMNAGENVFESNEELEILKKKEDSIKIKIIW